MDPDVLPWVTIPGVGEDDFRTALEPFLTDDRNVMLVCDGGALIFAWREPGIYEVHTNFRKTSRGGFALEASRAAYRWMFTRTECVVLRTKVPVNNNAALAFCPVVGATLEFVRPAVWPTEDGLVDLTHWQLTYEQWIRVTPELAESGKAFHAELDAEFVRRGVERSVHPDEECHDRHAGACAEMVYGGQPEKAVILYNRWARFAGYGQIEMIARFPLLIDIGDALLQVKPEERTFRAVKCCGPDDGRAPRQPQQS